MIELPGAAYFYTLATIAITFVTFSSLLIILRQTVGAGISAALLMIENAIGLSWHPAMCVHAVGVTLSLFTTGAAFLLSSKVVLEQGRQRMRDVRT